MIIDVHGHYTTAPKALEDWRNRQIAAINERSAMPKAAELKIGDDELRITTIFSGGVCTAATQPEAARAFLEFMASPEASEAKLRQGMAPA